MNVKQSLVEGLVAGLLGYIAVGVAFGIMNVLSGLSPFHTAFLLGEAMGAGAPGPNQEAGIILAANGLHLVLSLVVGTIAALLVAEVERFHSTWPGIFLVFVGGLIFIVVVAGVVGAELITITTWPRATLASIVFVLAVGATLGWMHRDLPGALGRELES